MLRRLVFRKERVCYGHHLQQAYTARHYARVKPLGWVTHVTSIGIDSRKHESALITAVAMQALRCLLRSRQDLGGRSISATLQRSLALSLTACNALEAADFSSKITSSSPSLGFHTADSSFSILLQQLEGFAQPKAQASGSGFPGRACIGKQLRAARISGSIFAIPAIF